MIAKTYNLPSISQSFVNSIANLFYRYISRMIPSKWFIKSVPKKEYLTQYNDRLSLELVSHCWNYSHLLAYNLTALVKHPPKNIDIKATIFFSPEDKNTQQMLNYFSKIVIPNITWNWQEMPREQLFRRAIGRNKAALATKADWVWYIDCDLILHEGCLDSLAASLAGQKELLLFPDTENITSLLEDNNPILTNENKPQLLDIDTSQFVPKTINRAVGAYQITHGDVARACGYCNNIRVYQTPSRHWQKTYEDTTYRWLLGTQGKAISVTNIYRIRHISKGRYKRGSIMSKIRSFIRVTESKLNE